MVRVRRYMFASDKYLTHPTASVRPIHSDSPSDSHQQEYRVWTGRTLHRRECNRILRGVLSEDGSSTAQVRRTYDTGDHRVHGRGLCESEYSYFKCVTDRLTCFIVPIVGTLWDQLVHNLFSLPLPGMETHEDHGAFPC